MTLRTARPGGNPGVVRDPTPLKTDPDVGRPPPPRLRRRPTPPGLADLLRDDPAADAAAGGPDVSLVRLIHRGGGNGAFVSFHAKAGGEFRDLFSVGAAGLDAAWPRAAPHLGADAYFSVNGFWRGGRFASRAEPTLPGAFRKCDGLRSLNACFVDLDCYKARLSPGAAVGWARRLVDAGRLPQPSVVVRSGRGVWLFWLLRDDDDPGRPVRAWPEAVDLYRAVQHALGRRLADLGADFGALDPARVTRVPGSVHPGTGRPVRYAVWPGGPDGGPDGGGPPAAYTLGGLAACVGVDPGRPTRRRPCRRPPAGDGGRPAPKRNANKRRGWRAMLDNRVRQFQALRAMRGGFAEGCRNRAALVYAHLLAMLGRPDDQIADEVRRLGAECHPPLSAGECDRAARQARRPRRFRDQTISDYLLVTPAESEAMGGWPPASCFVGTGGTEDAEPATRADRRRARRNLVRNLIGSGPAPTVRAMAAALADHGYAASVGTVHGDYAALGVVPGRAVAAGRRSRRRPRTRDVA